MAYPPDLTDEQWELIEHSFNTGRRHRFMRALAKYPSVEEVCADAGDRKTFEDHVKALEKP